MAAAWGREGLGVWSTSVPWLSMCSSHGRLCPCLLRLPEEGQGRPEGDGLLLGVAGKAAGTLCSGFRRTELSLSTG